MKEFNVVLSHRENCVKHENSEVAIVVGAEAASQVPGIVYTDHFWKKFGVCEYGKGLKLSDQSLDGKGRLMVGKSIEDLPLAV